MKVKITTVLRLCVNVGANIHVVVQCRLSHPMARHARAGFHHSLNYLWFLSFRIFVGGGGGGGGGGKCNNCRVKGGGIDYSMFSTREE